MPVSLLFPASAVARVGDLPPAFTCSWTNGAEDVAWVQVAGELDVATTEQLQHTLGEAQSQSRLVVLDLGGLTFLDSCGVHAIFDASVRARKAGRRLLVLRGPPHVNRVFALTVTSGDVDLIDLDSIPDRAGETGEAHPATTSRSNR